MNLVSVKGEKFNEQIWRTNHLCSISSHDSTFCYFKLFQDTKRNTNLNVQYDYVSLCDTYKEFALNAASVRQKGRRGVVWSLSRLSAVFSLIDRTIDFSWHTVHCSPEVLQQYPLSWNRVGDELFELENKSYSVVLQLTEASSKT